MEEIKLSREEERAIDQKLGPDFKKKMNEFAEKLSNLMMEFPMAQGHSILAEAFGGNDKKEASDGE